MSWSLTATVGVDAVEPNTIGQPPIQTEKNAWSFFDNRPATQPIASGPVESGPITSGPIEFGLIESGPTLVAPAALSIPVDPPQVVSGSFMLPGVAGTLFRLHHTAGEQFGAYPSVTSIGANRMIPLGHGVWLVDGQLLLNNDGELGGSFDSIWRWSSGEQTVWGLGVGADVTPTQGEHVAQGVVSLEMLRRKWGMRGNVYAPFDLEETTQSAFSTGYTLSGTSIVEITTQHLLREAAMSGVDIEFHRNIANVEMFAGAYTFESENSDASGFRLGARGDLSENFSANVQVTQDSFFDTRVSGGLTWYFGSGRSIRRTSDRRFTSPVRRNHYVSVDSDGSSLPAGTQIVTDQATGDPLHLFFASEGGAGTGAQGSPTDIATALASPNFGTGSVLVLLDAGGTITTPVQLTADRQQVLGAPTGALAIDLSSSVGQVGAKLALDGLGGRPTLEPTSGAAAIRLSSTGIGHVVSGLTLDGSGGVADGIRDFDGAAASPGGTDTLISDMVIRDFTGTGVLIRPSINTTIENTNFTGNGQDVSLNASNTILRNIVADGATGDSISLANTTGTTTVDNVTISNSTGAGLKLSNSGGQVNVSNLDVTDSGDSAVQVQAGDADIRFTTSTTITGSSGVGVEVQGGTAALTFTDLILNNIAGYGVMLDGHDGLFTVTQSLNVSGATGNAAVSVRNAGANAVANFGKSTISASGAGTLGVDLASNNANSFVVFEDLKLFTADGIGLRGDNGGIVNFTGTPAEVAANGGAAVDLNATRGRHDGVDGWMFTELSSTDSNSFGVRLESLLDEFQVVGATTIDNATGNGFEAVGGSSNVTLTSLSIDGAVNGLDLIDFGGIFTVSGVDSLAGSGGQLDNVDRGAYLENVAVAWLKNMNITATTRGIDGMITNGSDSTISIEDSTIASANDVGVQFNTTNASSGKLTANLGDNTVSGQAASVRVTAAGGDIDFFANQNAFSTPSDDSVLIDESNGATIAQHRTGNTTNQSDWARDESPLLIAGAVGADGKRETVIADPDVVYDSSSGDWHLYYFAARATEYGNDSDVEFYIQHATSLNGTGWTLDIGQALSLPGDVNAWDSIRVETPSVLIDPTASADRRFKLYYAGAGGNTPAGFHDYQLGLAFSSDGSTFTRLSAAESPYGEAGAVLRSGEVLGQLDNYDYGIVADPDIQLIDGTYNLWFSSFAADDQNNTLAFGISHATSADGINWSADITSPVPSLLWPQSGVGGQQPSVAYNSALDRWETYFTSDTAADQARMPSTFNPSTGVWMSTSSDYQNWTHDYTGRSFDWDGDSPHEELGLLTGLEVIVVDDVRHLFYTGWSSIAPPSGFVVPVEGGYDPAVLTLLHATQSAYEE